MGVEGMLGGGRLHERFDLVYGTSTGSIIAALICLGHSMKEIHGIYDEHVVKVMGKRLPWSKSKALRDLSTQILKERTFKDVKTDIGIVATNWRLEKPLIFKSSGAQAHSDRGNFEPGFGCKIGDAVQASCSGFPFFCRKKITTHDRQNILAADGGYCANNPALYAIADATEALKAPRSFIRLVSIGVGEYPSPKRCSTLGYWCGYLPSVRLLQKTMEINTSSMDQLRQVLFREVPTIRISNAYTEPEMATDMFEADREKLNQLYQRGRDSFRARERELSQFI